MRRLIPLCGALVASSVLTMAAQEKTPAAVPQGEYAERAPAGTPEGNFVIPLPSSRTLSPKELAGKKLFVQRCSVCHLPGLPTYQSWAPVLDRARVSAKGVEAVRQYISSGSPRMPGFRYTLQVNEIDDIVTYLKSLDLNRKPS